MNSTDETEHLRLFKSKIVEAVSIVPKMHVEEKLIAVHFWNDVSERLQVIVNTCAADINAFTVKIQENESDKLSLEMSSVRSVGAISNNSISSDFLNLSSTYGICSEIPEQYHSVDLNCAQLLTPETAVSIVREESVKNNSATNVPFIHHLTNTNSCERNTSNDYLPLENLTQSSCDTLGIESCSPSNQRTHKLDSITDSSSDEFSHQDQLVHQSSKDVKNLSSTSCQSNDFSLDSSHELLSLNQKNLSERNKSKIKSVLKDSSHKKQLKNKFNCDPVINSNENSVDSAKSDSNLRESDSDHKETIISFVVSCSEEILAKNGLTPEIDDPPGDKQHSGKSYACSDCSAKFSTRGNLIVHMRRHTGEKPYSCIKCSARFTTQGNLKRHLKTHTGEKPYECTSCGSKFTEKKSLTVHMRRHTGEKPYECKVCGKRFTQSGILQTHMAMHLNQKFHLCEHCGKSFRQRSQLQTHKLRHSNDRKYNCSSCSARFLTKGDLERHNRTHTGERPYVCKMCPKAYTRQQSLNEHLNRHLGIRPYKCTYCCKTFTEMSACYKHIKQHKKAVDKERKILTTEPPTEAPNLQDSNQTDSNSNSCKAANLPSCESSKPKANELHEENDENAVTNQSLVSFIEKFFN